MLLLDLKKYLQKLHFVTMLDMVKNFNKEANLLRDMLQHWIDKGKVRQLSKTSLCQTKCIKCDPLTTELYEWIE